MTALTLFLAKLIGALLATLAAAMVARAKEMAEIAQRAVADPMIVMFSGVLRTGFGLAIVIGHDIWSGGALPVAVTLFGWALYLSGLLLLFASQERLQRILDAMGLQRNMTAYAAGIGLLGLYYLAAGLVG
ncbi:hypothetical protein [Methylocystis heyeri]|uniref:Uncharacterized protein n=1 Tax=Methylocystis heyeri TaxID=391905 RepID=A0A6B8KH52_9HYPH|nr:hypothetical protein [Methylocystis heyeri]QGM46295.1 hypothetical protein H2LOC_011640 [Methylocystis heyeri]